tara:strand:- start:466 stop:780 length:315 start_codon:yes stop_codon:yes gene_type:complete
MQTEFIEWCGSFIAFSMIIGVLYVALTTKNPTNVSDIMTIGYVEEDRPQNIVVTMPVIDEQLKIDCIDTLVKLGMKKKQARQYASKEFSSNPPKSIQEFLKRVL